MSDTIAEGGHSVASVNPYASGDEAWRNAEANRLRDMDAFLEPFTRQDLEPAIAMQRGERPDRAVELLDIGAAVSPTVEAVAAEADVTYYALDVDAGLLEQRDTPAERTIVSPSQEMAVDSGRFDITYSRAATAWSPDPPASISEQLRVTRDGGVAVFSEFDWSAAGADAHTEAGRALNGIKSVLEMAITLRGFRTEYGHAQLAQDIDEAADRDRLAYNREETVHELPPGDYREFMLNMAGQLVEAVADEEDRFIRMLSHDLQMHMKVIEQAQEVEFSLPRIVTQRVEVMGRTPDPFADEAAA